MPPDQLTSEELYERAKRVHVCAEGWICEAHPDRGWPHDDRDVLDPEHCGGPGIECPHPDCPASFASRCRLARE